MIDMMDMANEIAAEIGAMQVTSRNEEPARGVYLEGLVTGFKVVNTRGYGRLAILDVLVTKAEAKDEGVEPNSPGTTVSRKFYIDSPKLDKKEIARKNLRRELCALAKAKPDSVSEKEFTSIFTLATQGAFNGSLVKFDPFDYTNKEKKTVKLHNFALVFGKNDPKEVAARAKALTEGVDPSTLV